MTRGRAFDRNDPRYRFLTTKEAAAALRCSERTIFRWTRLGLLHPIRRGGRLFFRRTEIQEIWDA